MNVFIRTDASASIGTGHVMRCLVLADDLRKEKVAVSFICRPLEGHLIHYIRKRGYTVHVLPCPKLIDSEARTMPWTDKIQKMDAEQTIQVISGKSEIHWLISDHYGIDRRWERLIKPFVQRLMVIDDLANRPHDCHLLLDQNLYKNADERYTKLIPEQASALLGIKYLLLRPEFRSIKNIKTRDGTIERLLVSFGGSDPTHETLKALQAIERLNQPNLHVDVVVGFSNGDYFKIKEFAERMPGTVVHHQIDYLARLMTKADLSIGAGGSTTWERCFVRLPALTIETADNQSEILSFLKEEGAVCHLGVSDKVTENDISVQLEKLLSDPGRVRRMSARCALMMVGYEKCSVAKRLLEGRQL